MYVNDSVAAEGNSRVGAEEHFRVGAEGAEHMVSWACRLPHYTAYIIIVEIEVWSRRSSGQVDTT